MSWPQLLLAVHGAYPYFANPQVLVDDAQVPISRQTDILSIPENRTVNVSVGCVNEEFRNTNYEKFNKSMCQLMDSMEIMMHVPTAKPSDGADASSTTA